MNGYYNGYPGYEYITEPIRNYGAYAPLTRSAISAGTRAPSILGTLSRSPGILGSTALGSTAATTGAKAFSFSGLLNGASKTLGVINQAIPVVYQIKPIWTNAKTMFRVAKAINSPDKNSFETTTNSTRTTNVNTQNNSSNSSSSTPTFFN